MTWPFASKPFPNGIKQERHRLSSGHVDLPILYRDLTAFSATYTADAKAVQSALPSYSPRGALYSRWTVSSS